MSWNQSSQASSRKKSSSGTGGGRRSRGLIAALIVVIGAAVAWLILSQKQGPSMTKPETPGDTNRLIKTVTPAAASKAAEEEKPVENKAAKERRELVEKLKNMPPEQRRAFLEEEVKRKPLDFKPKKRQLYATGTEQVMAMIFTTQLGDTPPPLPNLPIRDEAHLTEILMNRVEAQEGDSEKALLSKQTVQQVKDEVRKYIKEGGNIQDFLSYYHGKLVEANQELRLSRQEAMRIVREDPGIAREYIAEINKRLKEKGIREVNVPLGYLKKYGVPDED